MAEKYQRQRNRMLKETSDRKVRYHLYKSGKNWVIAGVSTLILSTAVFVGNGAVAKAATPSADTTPATSDSTTGALSTDGDSTVLKTGSSDSTTAPTESGTTTSATARNDAATTGTSTGNDTTDEAKDASDAGKTVVDATDSTQDDASELAGGSPTGTEKQTETDATESSDSSSNNATGESTTSVNANSTADETVDASESVNVDSPITYADGSAKSDVATSENVTKLSDVNPAAVDVTGKLSHYNINTGWVLDGNDYMTTVIGQNASGQDDSLYFISSTGTVMRAPYLNATSANVDYTKAKTVTSATTIQLIKTILGSDIYSDNAGTYKAGNSNGAGYVPQGIKVSATNTRTNNGQVQYTADTKLTIDIPATTVTLPTGTSMTNYNVSLETSIMGSPIAQNPTATMSNNTIKYNAKTISAIPMVSRGDGSAGRSFEINYTIKLADTKDADTSIRVRSLPTKIVTQSYNLTPIVNTTVYNADSTTLNGTAYRAGDTIYLKDATTNTTLAQVTSDANGYWTFNLDALSLTPANNLFVQEDGTHVYGDGAGVAVVPQNTKATRTITYVDAVTGKTLNTTKSDMTLTRTNSIARTDGVALIESSTPVKTATTTTKYTITPGTYKNTDNTATDGLNFSAITNANLEAFDGYTTNANLAAIAAVPGQDVAQTVYEYPAQLTVDPNADPNNLTTAVVTPQSGDTPINATDKTVTYPSGISEADLTNTVTRTVNYVDAAGNSIANKMPAVTETAYFTRTATLTLNADSTGYDVAYGDWTLKKVNNAEVADQVISDETPYSFGTVDTSAVAGMTYVSTSDSPATVSKTDLDAMVADKTKAALATTVTYDYIALTPKITSIAQNADGKTIMQGTGTLAGDTLFMIDKNNNYHGQTTVNADGTWSIDITTAAKNSSVFLAYESNDLGDQFGMDMAMTQRTATETIHRINGLTGETMPEGDLTKTASVHLNYVLPTIVSTAEKAPEVAAWTANRTAPTNTLDGPGTQMALRQLAALGDFVPGDSTLETTANKISANLLTLFAGTTDTLKDSTGNSSFAALSSADLAIDGYTTTDTVPETAYTGTSNQPVAADYTVYYYPASLTVDPNITQNTTATIVPGDADKSIFTTDANSPKYPAGVSTTDLTKTVNETIHYQMSDGTAAPADTTTTDGLDYTRTATITWTDGQAKVEYGKWTLKTGETAIAAVTNPTVAGYVAATATTPAYTDVDAVTTRLNDADTTNDGNVDVTTLYFPATVTVTPDQNGDHVDGTKVTDNPADPRTYTGVSNEDLTKSITETVNYVDQDGKALPDADGDTSQKATLTFTQGATITYSYDTDGKLQSTVTPDGKWVANSNGGVFAAVTGPTISGYTAVAPAAEVDANALTTDVDEKIVYVNNDQLQHVVTLTTTYGDPSTKAATTDTYTFYRNVAGLNADGTVKYTVWTTNANGKSVSGNDQGVEIDNPDLSEGTAYEIDPDLPDVWGDSSQYTVSKVTAVADGQTIFTENDDSDSDDLAFTLTGNMTNVQRTIEFADTYAHIVFVDADDGDRVVATTDLPATAGMYASRPQDYTISKTDLKGTSRPIYTIDPNTVSQDAERARLQGTGESLPIEAGKTYTIELRHTHSQRTVQQNRVINYVYEDGTTAVKSDTQTSNWTQDRDLVAYYAGSTLTTPVPADVYTQTSGFAEQAVPTVPNYTAYIGDASVTSVPATTASTTSQTTAPTNADPITVTYKQTTFTPDKPGAYTDQLTTNVTRTINYVAVTDQTVNMPAPTVQTVTYNRTYDSLTNQYSAWTTSNDQFAELTNLTPVPGYITATAAVPVATASTPADDATLETVNNTTVTVNYYPMTVTVTTPTKADTPSVADDPDSPKLPEIKDTDLSKTITETVNYQNADGTTDGLTTKMQPTSVNFTRTATITYTVVDGQFTPVVGYSDWVTGADNATTGSWAELQTPEVDGKVADRLTVPSTDVTEDTTDSTLTVTYYPKTVTVTPDQPKTATDKITDTNNSPLYPAGVDEADLNKSVTETINYVDGDTGAQVADSTANTINFTRNATVTYTNDNGTLTGTVTYGNWMPTMTTTAADGTTTTSATDTFAAVTAPTVVGYTAPANQVPTVQVTADSEDFTNTVKYFADSDLKHDVTVTTNYKAATDLNGNVVKAAKDGAAVTTISFYRQPTYDATTGEYGFTDWTTNTDGISTSTADQTGTVSALSESDVTGNLANFTFTVTVTSTSDTGNRDTVTYNPNADDAATQLDALENDAITVLPTDTSITRDVSYSDNKYQITFVDVDNKDANGDPTVIGSVQYVGATYDMPVGDVPDWGLLEIDTDGTYLSEEGGTPQTDNKGNVTESFTAEAGKTYTIQLKHKEEQSAYTQHRTIDYVINDNGDPDETSLQPSPVTQTVDWTQNTDLYVRAKANDNAAADGQTTSGVTIDLSGVTYTQNATKANGDANVFTAVTSPTVTNFVADTATVAAVDAVTGVVNTAPADLDPVTVTYTRNVFTTEHPGAYADDLTKNITRTINYVDATDGTTSVATPAVQTVTYTRQVTIDPDGTLDYSDWAATADDNAQAVTSFAEVTSPTDVKDAAGNALYTPTTTTPAQDNVTVDTPDSVVTVKYYPTTITVDGNTPINAGTDIVAGDDNGPKYPAGLTAAELQKTLTYTVHFVDGVGNTVSPDQSSTVTFTRSATVNVQTGEVTYEGGSDDWRKISGSQTATSVTALPTVTGMYTDTTLAEVASHDFTAADTDASATVTYYPTTVKVTPDEPKNSGDHVVGTDGPTYPVGVSQTDLNQTATRTIKYVSQDGDLLNTQTQTVNFQRGATINVQTGDVTYDAWQPVGTDTFAEVTVPTTMPDKDGNATYFTGTKTVAALQETAPIDVLATVYYYNILQTVTPDDPKNANTSMTGIGTTLGTDPNTPTYPAGVSATDLNKTATRTIRLDDYDTKAQIGTVDAAGQTLSFKRSATVNMLTGNVTYGAWQADGDDTTFDEVTNIPATSTDGKLFTNTTSVAALSETSPVDTTAVVYYYSPTYSVDKTTIPGTKVNPDDPNSPVLTGFTQADLTGTATQEVKYVDQNGNSVKVADGISDSTQTLHFERTATVNVQDSTQTPEYSDWTPTSGNTFAEIPVQKVTDNGQYFTTQGDILSQVVTEPTQNPTTVSVVYYPTTMTIDPDNPQTVGTPIDGTTGAPTYPAGITANDLNRTVTQTIHYVDVNGHQVADTVTTKLGFNRTATLTEQNGQYAVDYGDWTPVAKDDGTLPNTFAAVTNPDLTADNLFTNTAQIDAMTETDPANVSLTVTYYPMSLDVTPDQNLTPGEPISESTTPNKMTDPSVPVLPDGVTAADLNGTATETVHYIDAATGDPVLQDGQPVADGLATVDYQRTAHVAWAGNGAAGVVTYSDWTPKTAKYAAVTSPVIDGMMADQPIVPATDAKPIAGTTAADALTGPTATVNYYSTSVEVTPGNGKTEGTPVVTDESTDPNDPSQTTGPKYPAGVTDDSLTHTVTRTIIYMDATSGQVIKQVPETLTFTRTATVTYTSVDGDPIVEYGKWVPVTTNTLEGVDSPSINNLYTLTPSIAARDVTDDEINANAELSERVTYYSNTVMVTPDDPKNKGDQAVPGDNNSPEYPDGVSEQNLKQTATQTIVYVNEDGGQEVAPSHQATLTFERTATVTFNNDGTPAVTYGTWTAVNGNDTFGAIKSPEVPGKTPDLAEVMAMQEAMPANVLLHVYYTPKKGGNGGGGSSTSPSPATDTTPNGQSTINTPDGQVTPTDTTTPTGTVTTGTKTPTGTATPAGQDGPTATTPKAGTTGNLPAPIAQTPAAKTPNGLSNENQPETFGQPTGQTGTPRGTTGGTNEPTEQPAAQLTATTKSASNTSEKTLPQTSDDNDEKGLSAIGLSLAGILSLFGLGRKRKRED